MSRLLYMLGGCSLALSLPLAIACHAVQETLGWDVPSGTAIPVEFLHTLNTAKAKAGDRVDAKTLQVVHLPQGRDITKGSLVEGEIVAAEPKHGDDEVSVLAFKLDRIVTPRGWLRVRLYARALTGNLDSFDAELPTPPPDSNTTNTRTLIGGDQVMPRDPKVHALNGDVVGANTREGVVERLLPAHSSRVSCDGTTTQQAVAIYSGGACGLYGFGDVLLAHTGKNNDGTIELDSRQHNVELFARSTALLQAGSASGASKPERK